jgi:alanyl-tRNA synthetase
MTERLYYFDSYLRRFVARVLRSTETEKGFEFVLDQTGFYPTSGGQPHDLGTIQGVPLEDVFENQEDEIIHRTAQPFQATLLDCHVDWHRRFDHMQQHTGQHILSQAFVRTSGFNTVGFHMGANYVTIDLDAETVNSQQTDEAENLANAVVFENRPVRAEIITPERLPELNLRKVSQREGPIRVVQVEDFDTSACGGTHVRRTGEIGTVVIRKVERVNRQARIEFVCGQRGIAAQKSDRQNLEAIARQFSVGLSEAPARVGRQIEEARQLRKALQVKNRALANLLAKELFARSGQGGTAFRVVKQLLEDEEMEFLKLLAQSILAQGPCIVLLASRGQQATLVFAQSEASSLDLRMILSECCSLIRGKGGGTRTLVQARGENPALLQEALDLAQRHIPS